VGAEVATKARKILAAGIEQALEALKGDGGSR
jgi:hypothetical protein